MNRLLLRLVFGVMFCSVFTVSGRDVAYANNESSNLTLFQFNENDTVVFNDSLRIILKELDSLMTDSLSQIVLDNEKPFIPGKDGMIFPDPKDFVNNSKLYDFKYITRRLTREDRRKLAYKSQLAFDTKVNYNPFRYMIWPKGLVLNYYSLYYVTYDDFKMEDLWDGKQLMLDTDTLPKGLLESDFSNAAYAETKTWLGVRENISFTQPSVMDLHWNQLPDPPLISDTLYLPIVNRVQLDYKNFSGEERDYVRKITGYKQEKSPWTIVGYSALQANETYIENWAKGGESSISMLGIGRLEIDYVVDGLKWENNFEIKLGAFKQFNEEGENKIRKNDDQLKISSKIGYKAFKDWFYTANFDFETQFFDGYDLKKQNFEEPISAFLSPAKTYISLGMDYKYNKNFLSVFISPLTLKYTYISDTSRISISKYGIEDSKRSKTEAGAYIKGTLKWLINSDMRVESKLYLFSNYVENPENIDIDWEGEYEYRFSHVFSMRFAVNLKYDDDEDILLDVVDGEKIYGKRLQIKQLMSIGISYRF